MSASEPFVGQIQTFGFNFSPANWALCNGALMSIANNQALFALIGTTYGGDGVNTFAVPDLQGRVPIHQGTGAGLSTYAMGQKAGVENVTLTLPQIPAHSHAFLNTSTVNSVQTRATTAQAASGSLLARSIDANATGDAIPQIYVPAGTAGTQAALGGLTASGSNAVQGGSQPHTNIQPYLTINTSIALFGVFPSRN